jgi:hypothetical protein
MILCLLAFEGKAQTIKTVGPSGDYTTLKLAFDAINAGTISGDITLQITGSTTETASAVLNASGTGGASYTAVSISPTTSGVTISGNITGALVDLNGADHVSINGQYNGNKELTLSNTATGSSSTVRFIGDASNNTITNCNLLGSSSTAAYGVVLFSTGKPTTGVGNDSNIRPEPALPSTTAATH